LFDQNVTKQDQIKHYHFHFQIENSINAIETDFEFISITDKFMKLSLAH
jgi:hypothetical protein